MNGQGHYLQALADYFASDRRFRKRLLPGSRRGSWSQELEDERRARTNSLCEEEDAFAYEECHRKRRPFREVWLEIYEKRLAFLRRLVAAEAEAEEERE